MYLTVANVLHYLVEKRFANAADVVSGRYAVRSLSRRNRNFRVTSGGREYLVKQVKNWNVDGLASLEREAAIYWRARTDPDLAPVARLAPQCHAWDTRHSILILEYLPHHSEIYDLPDRFAPELARLTSQTMGEFHRAMSSDAYEQLFPGEAPWQFSMAEASDDDWKDESGGRKELIVALRKYPEFAAVLGRLREEWQPSAVIQGDWKLDNCLVPADRKCIRLVDWEFAAWGDPAWDLATLLQSYWNFWVRWPVDYSIEEIQPALRAAVAGYGNKDVAERAFRFAAVRMLQTAFEHLEKKDSMTAEAVRLLQTSLNILQRPEWAARQLLGTP